MIVKTAIDDKIQIVRPRWRALDPGWSMKSDKERKDLYKLFRHGAFA
jgi:hypothetical protein